MNTRESITQSPPVKQHGAALATALIMLLVLTVVGVSALNTITVEETMAGNLRDQIIAFQATETALSEAEYLLEDTDFPFVTKVTVDCKDGASPAICKSNEGGSQFYFGTKQPFEENAHNDAFWDTSNGAFQYAGSPIYGVNADPSYFIEKTGTSKRDSMATGTDSMNQDGVKEFYTSTSRGKGGNPNTVSMVQVTTAVRGIQ